MPTLSLMVHKLLAMMIGIGKSLIKIMAGQILTTRTVIPQNITETKMLIANNHTQYLTEVNNSEVHRGKMASGQSYLITGIQFLQRGGGSLNEDCFIELYDVTNASSIVTCSLNEVKDVSISTATAIIFSVRVTNGSGVDVDACYSIKGHIQNA